MSRTLSNPTRVPPAARLIRLSLLAAALLLAAAAHQPAAAEAASGVIVRSGERSPLVPVSQIVDKADVASETFQKPGSGPTPDGLSMRRLMSMVAVDPDRVRSVRITGDDGTALQLPRHALKEPYPYGKGPTIPPVVWADDTGVHFVRVEGDGNPAQETHATGGQPLLVEVEGGETIDVTAEADRTKIEAGDRVRFRASVDSPPPGGLRYSWDFGDGRRASGETAVHAFTQPGRYTAFVTVSGPTALGHSNRITITVGQPPPERKPRKSEREPSPDEVVAATPSERPGGPPPASGPGGRKDRKAPTGGPRDDAAPPEPAAPARPEPKAPEGELVAGELVSGPADPAGGRSAPGGMVFEDARLPEIGDDGPLGTALASAALLLLAAGATREWWRSGDRPWW